MDPSPRSFPVLSYVMARLPTFGPKTASEYDIEQPETTSSLGDAHSQRNPLIVDQMPHLSDPKLISAMRRAIHDVYQTRSVLKTIGPRPDHETVDKTKARIVEIESELAQSLEEIAHSIRSTDGDQIEWEVKLAEKEKECRDNAAKETSRCRKILELDEMHEAYEKMLKDAEDRLVKIYERAENGEEESEAMPQAKEDVNEEVVALLQEASGKSLERVDLSSRQLRFLPEAFGRMAGLRFLNLSHNLLEVVPDSIAGLVSLEELNLASNLLETLPDSLGLLSNLKLLNVSGNRLSALPDSISHCRSLVELDVGFNRITYLPTNIGCELVNLLKLLIPLNKIRYLPSSIGEMVSLRHLDARFNELHGLPVTIGKLTNLEILNLSSNFTDLKELPETFGEMTNLKELDLSNNQIHALPDTFGRLDKLTKLNLKENPLVMPPVEVVKEGVEAVKLFMAKRWLDMLVEEKRRSMGEGNDIGEQAQAGWLTRSTSWLKTVGENVLGAVSPRSSPRDPCLDQQF